MARRLRLEYAGALYHLTARGNERRAIFRNDIDRQRFLALLACEIKEKRWRLHAYCLMDNHYHLIVETPEPNLARGMRRLNSAYSQHFNRRYHRVGHLFQGRYHSVLVQRESYLLELSRYVVLNPVRAGMVDRAHQWPWSSYRATAGLVPAPVFLEVRWLLEQFHSDPEYAQDKYQRFVNQDEVRCPWDDLRGSTWLGSESFLEFVNTLLKGKSLCGVPTAQRQPLRPTQEQIIASILDAFSVTEQQLWKQENPEAFDAAVYLLRRGAKLSIRAVADLGGVSARHISVIQRRIEDSGRSGKLHVLLDNHRFRLSDSERQQEYQADHGLVFRKVAGV